MSGPEPATRYAVPLDELEATAHVPLENQTSEQPSGTPDLVDSEQLDERRQFRLAGGA